MASSPYDVRKVPEEAFALIREWEGFSEVPYLNSHKIWCIGYGHSRTVRAGQKKTREEAEALLADDMRLFGRAVHRLVTVPLNDQQFGALVAFCFDRGILWFEGCRLLALLNRGWYDQVPAQLLKFTKIAGEPSGSLHRRRAAEARLWNSWRVQEERAA